MALNRVGVYPGTFDPITSGHMEVVRRSLRLVDKLIIGPATNIGKGPLFSLQERIDIIKDEIHEFSEADRDSLHVRLADVRPYHRHASRSSPSCVRAHHIHDRHGEQIPARSPRQTQPPLSRRHPDVASHARLTPSPLAHHRARRRP